MLSVNFLLEFIQLYIVTFSMTNIPKDKRLGVMGTIIFISLAAFDTQRFIGLGGGVIWVESDTLIYLGLALLMVFWAVRKSRLILPLINLLLFNNFIRMLIAGITVTVFPISMSEIIIDPLHVIINRLLSILLLLGISYAMKRIHFKLDVASLGWKEVLFTTILLLTFGYYVGLMQRLVEHSTYSIEKFMFLMAGFGGLAVLCLTISYLLNKNRLREVESLRQIQEELFYRQRRYHRTFMEQAEETKKFRHDTANHYMIILRLIQQKAYEQLERYVIDLSGSLVEIKEYMGIDTGLEVVNAVLLDLQSRYKEDEIEVEWEKALPPNTKISDKDMAVILMNLLENAFLATSQMVDDKFVHVKVHVEDQHLYIGVKNSFNGQLSSKNGKIKTVKQDKMNHGYGIQIVQDMMTKYDGECHITHEGNEFFVEITFTSINF